MRILMIIACSFFALNALTESEKTKDPYKFVWSEEDGRVSGMVRFWVDLDGDKKDEVFVGAKALMGTGGGLFHVFKVLGTRNYRYLGKVDVHPETVQILTASRNGFRQFKSYWHLSAENGDLNTFTFDGTKFIKTAKKKINAEDLHKNLTATQINLQDSGPTLTWEP